MKDNLFELLFNLFEQSLSQLQKEHQPADNESNDYSETELSPDEAGLYIKPAQKQSTRVLTYFEQMRLTKAGYQFLMKMKLLGIVNDDTFELVMNQVDASDSRIVTLREIKWIIRNILAHHFDEKQLAFLDLVLYQTEDAFTLH